MLDAVAHVMAWAAFGGGLVLVCAGVVMLLEEWGYLG